MDDYWKQLRWIASRRAWVAISGDIKIIVSENTYDQHLKAHFARLGVGRQTWYKIMQDAHDEWQVHDRRYFSETSMALLAPPEPDRDTEPAAITSGP